MGVILDKLNCGYVFTTCVVKNKLSFFNLRRSNIVYLSKSELQQLIAELSEIESKLIE